MAKGNEAYVDTSALIAFLDRSDFHHELFKRLFSNPPSLVTTVLVVAEGHAWFLRRYDRTRAMQFLKLLEVLPSLSIQSVGRTEQSSAAILLRKFSDQDLTLVDAVGLHLIQQKRLASCWSTDFHLGLTGVPLVINQF